MSLPAAIALCRRRARSLVVAASKNNVSSRFFSAPWRSVVQRAMPFALASCASLASLRPTRIGSGITLSPFLRATPPAARIATIERIKCWFMPMRPVTPFMMMPSRCCAMLSTFHLYSVVRPSSSAVRHQQPVDPPAVLPEFLAGFAIECAGMAKLDAEIVSHARRACGQYDDAGAEEYCLADAVGHEHDGFFCLFSDSKQFEIHLLPGESVERTERFIHQDELGVMDERPCDRGALLHATR